MKTIKNVTPPKGEDNVIRIKPRPVSLGHLPHTPGCGAHDNREKRCRTRQQQLRRALEE